MGAYEDYLKRKSVNETGETFDEKIDAAMDMDEVYKTALERLKGFVDAYVVATETERQYAADRREKGKEEAFTSVLERRIQEVATTGEGDASKPKLLLDDLRIILEALR